MSVKVFFPELLCIHSVGMVTFGHHGLILCVIGTFGLHGLILCVSEDLLSELLCIHNVGMVTFGLHGLILCVS